MNIKKIDELIDSNKKLAELFGRKSEQEKKCHTVVWVLAIIGAVAAVAGIAYAVYRHMNKECFDDLEFEDFDEEEFEEEETTADKAEDEEDTLEDTSEETSETAETL